MIRLFRQLRLAAEYSENVFFLKDQTLLVLDPELATGILVKKHLVTDFHVLDLLADGLNDAPLWLFLGRIRHINSAGRPVQFFSVGDEHAVTQGLKALGHVLLFLRGCTHGRTSS